MRLACAAAVLLAMSAPVFADPPKTPDFVPFVVDQQQYQAALTYLNGLTFKDALPLVKWLNEQEERAKGQWEADNRPKEEKPK